MGLFSKKSKQIDIIPEASQENKRKMREMFDASVEDAGSYRILHAGSSDQTFTRGLVSDTRTTTFHQFILGYRESDYQVVILEIDPAIRQHGEPFYIAIDEIKETNYYPKYHQAWLIYRDGPQYGVKLEIGDCSSTSAYGMRNVEQSKEREAFLDFLEKYTDELRRRGYKIKPWKR